MLSDLGEALAKPYSIAHLTNKHATWPFSKIEAGSGDFDFFLGQDVFSIEVGRAQNGFEVFRVL
jgi:hypothetical protein